MQFHIIIRNLLTTKLSCKWKGHLPDTPIWKVKLPISHIAMGVSQNSFRRLISMHLLYDFAELNSPFASVPRFSLLTYSINIDYECLKCLVKAQYTMVCVGSFFVKSRSRLIWMVIYGGTDHLCSGHLLDSGATFARGYLLGLGTR